MNFTDVGFEEVWIDLRSTEMPVWFWVPVGIAGVAGAVCLNALA
ncbi:hypothetical protein SAMN04488075_0828 [Paracoccus alkenifer]|uniref:Uncharacterized protein n=1 Tax=Paracoccus alkenifer TaxID=65735 RepID=A0A1H6K338_9RHOB|nr:hypothetical protein SAMN04488075_0828 [Paracoccus alkenifer]